MPFNLPSVRQHVRRMSAAYLILVICLISTALVYLRAHRTMLERDRVRFEEIIRTTRDVNRGLQKTLKEEPHRFLAYNYGLCCTAAEVRMSGGKLEWLKDFQIVNGGQTTASIYHAVKKERLR